MESPFEDDDGRFYAVVNDDGQYSIWPTFAEPPEGWTVVFGDAARAACLKFIEESWTDMRPTSLVWEMEGSRRNSLS